MASLATSLRQLRCSSQLVRTQWRQPASIRSSVQSGIRCINNSSLDAAFPETAADAEHALPLPFAGIKHARAVPATPSYFCREPQFNDLYVSIFRLLAKYHHLPSLDYADTPPAPWVKLDEIRSKLGEPVKASHFAKVMRVAKRLNQIEPNRMPEEVVLALDAFKKDINPFSNVPRARAADEWGRAIGIGKRKESSARAWVVEGTGEVFVNGKPLSDAFGRVHDRESAIWALQATERLDKYNVWALVGGGGLTGQAEAVTLAVARALLVHEPALKPALRKGTCSPNSSHGGESFRSTKTNLPDSSRLHHEGPENCGEEEARPCQGAQDAGLGEAIAGFFGKLATQACTEVHGVAGGREMGGERATVMPYVGLYYTVKTIMIVVLESQNWLSGPTLMLPRQLVTSCRR